MNNSAPHPSPLPKGEGVVLGKYKHYKGNFYEVFSIAKHSETLELMVVYKALYQKEGENIWVRPLKMFTETVNVNGKDIPRFEIIEK